MNATFDASFPPLVRTADGPTGRWAELLRVVGTPSEDEFLANLEPLDDPAWRGAGPADLRAGAVAGEDGAVVLFAADERALGEADFPVLVIDLVGDEAPFRCVATELWAVENNLSLANLDWEDFASAVEDDGVYRGF